MSHEFLGSDRRILYTMPSMPSDLLRSMEFSEFFKSYRGPIFLVRTKDGWSWSSAMFRTPASTVTFKSRALLDSLMSDASENALGTMFLDGGLDIEGDSFALFAVAEYALRHSENLSHGIIRTLTDASKEAFHWLRPHKAGSALGTLRSATCRSELPINFFEHWLGSSLGQTCGAFHGEPRELEAAQHSGLEQVCSLLDLNETDRLLDMRCGWGSLLLHAATSRRSKVLGIAASHRQASMTAQLIRSAGLDQQCSVQHRNVATASYPAAAFDKIADVNILEQAATSRIPCYFEFTHHLLAPGGQLLLHRMTRAAQLQQYRGNSAQDMLFSAGCAPLSAELQAAESAGLEVRNVQTLSEDLRQTLRIWIARLQESTALETRQAQHRGHRAWLLYLVDAAANLESGHLQFHQILLRRPTRPGARPIRRAAETCVPVDIDLLRQMA